jgi:hypothetical protein
MLLTQQIKDLILKAWPADAVLDIAAADDCFIVFEGRPFYEPFCDEPSESSLWMVVWEVQAFPPNGLTKICIACGCHRDPKAPPLVPDPRKKVHRKKNNGSGNPAASAL